MVFFRFRFFFRSKALIGGVTRSFVDRTPSLLKVKGGIINNYAGTTGLNQDSPGQTGMCSAPHLNEDSGSQPLCGLLSLIA